MFSNLPPMEKRKFRKFESKVINFGSVRATRIQARSITKDDQYEINKSLYFRTTAKTNLRKRVELCEIPHTYTGGSELSSINYFD